MQKLGLTGSIASGKSTALKIFAELGVPVFSSDDVVHELYRAEAVAPIEALFPGAIRAGEVDRVELSRQLVAAPEKLQALEAIVHPLVRDRIAKFLADTELSGAALAVVDIPLLFESGYPFGLDKVAVTAVDDTTIRARALARPGMTVEKLDAILARQMQQAEKRGRADYILDTSGSLADTRNQVAALVEDLTTPG
ncbi:MAG: dephospho-CoA kinase [Devosia sp.]